MEDGRVCVCVCEAMTRTGVNRSETVGLPSLMTASSRLHSGGINPSGDTHANDRSATCRQEKLFQITDRERGDGEDAAVYVKGFFLNRPTLTTLEDARLKINPPQPIHRQ